MSKEIFSDLKQGDTCYMFGGRPSGATGVVEVKVKKVGRAYLYTTRPENFGDKFGQEWKFDRQTGVEDVDSNYKRRLVIDRDAYLLDQKTRVAYMNLRQAIGTKLPDDVTYDDIVAAAKLLRIDLKQE